MSGDSENGSTPAAVPSSYDEYVATREGPRFTDWLRGELDREGGAVSPRRQDRIQALFRRTVELEVAFFDAAYEAAEDTRGEP